MVKSMAVRQPRYSKEEFAQRGDEIYEFQVRQQVEEGNHGRIVAIDIETGAFELADDTMTATRGLYDRMLPDAQPWVIRIGHRAVHRFGARSLKDSLCYRDRATLGDGSETLFDIHEASVIRDGEFREI